ncbi:MAG: thioredoxin family protein [Saprospiraceae bacterium]
MSLTESKMLPLGSLAPDFTLPDTISDQLLSLQDLKGEKGTVIMFICNHCPYVLHVNDELIRIAKDYQSKGIAFIAISSNDAQKYPMDGPAKMKIHAKTVGYPFPYLYDESQDVARAYDAACTPDLYVFDAESRLSYRGRLDGSRPNNQVALSGEDLRAALDAILHGNAVAEKQYPSAGCNIKWKN